MNEDFLDLLKTLQGSEARFLLVGAHAIKDRLDLELLRDAQRSDR